MPSENVMIVSSGHPLGSNPLGRPLSAGLLRIGVRRPRLCQTARWMMQYTTLGRTGLRVSVAGLGTGGFSRLGLKSGQTEDESARLIHEAYDLGINFIDTAANYGTEGVVGRALKTLPRDKVVVATKAQIRNGAGAKEVAA